MSMDSEASVVYPEQRIIGRAAGYTGKLETCAFESYSTTLTAATHILGDLVPPHLL